jgi:diguanylate cyclase (GGDEF)-like protein/PAS domain S-box-containing protein
MKRPDSKDNGLSKNPHGPGLLEDSSSSTQPIDLDSVYGTDNTVPGDFDIGDVQATSLGKLLDAMPIPSLILDQSHAIVFTNKACSKISPDHRNLRNGFLSSLFPLKIHLKAVESMMEKVFLESTQQTAEGILGFDDGRIWGRMHMRLVRVLNQRQLLMTIEDLTLEKKQKAQSRKHSMDLRKAHDAMQNIVEARTSQLVKTNVKLKQEVIERRRAEAGLKLAANVIESSNEAIIITDIHGNIVDVNGAFCRVTGFTKQEVIGRNPKMMQSGRHDDQFWKDMWDTLNKEGHWKGEVWDRRKSGEIFPKFLSISAVANDNEVVTHYVGIFSDISSTKHTEKKLEQLSHYDPLTGLPNRMLFRDRLYQALLKGKRTGELVALMLLDLDGFKNINETLGHKSGDTLLNMVSQQIRSSVRKSDTVARLGGDEFALVLTDFAHMRSLDFLARKLLFRLAQPIKLSGRKIFITASIGISVSPNDGSNVDRLLQSADTAVHHAKNNGKNRFQYFSEEMNEKALDRLELETSLREAIQRNEFLLYYQPQIDLATERIVAAEALIRWNHPTKGLILPGRFIGLAEETGLVVPLGEWVIEKACRQSVQWQKDGLPPIRIGVNVSGHQIVGSEIVPKVLHILQQTGLDPVLLELEMTERTLMQDTEMAMEILNELKGIGVTLSIDDFGTGYSSLSYLKKFPVDKLKIDRSFVKDVGDDPDDEAIVKAIIAVAHSLKMTVIAEGAETKEQVAFLRDNDCDEIQGYYFSPPLPPENFTQLLDR